MKSNSTQLIVTRRQIGRRLGSYLITTLMIGLFLLNGCATPGIVGILKDKGALTSIFNKHKDWDEATRDNFTKGELQLGMKKGQVLYLQGSPNNWSKYKIGNDVYESWHYPLGGNDFSTSDFKNGVLVGYSVRGRYYSAEGIEDVRSYK